MESSPATARRWQIGITAVVASAALVVYGAYGDPQPKSSQESAVPYIVAVLLVIAAVMFGWLVPKGRSQAGRAGRWGLTMSVVGLALVPIAFWSGLPILFGGAGALTAWEGAAAGRSRTKAWAVILGILAAVASIAVTVLDNSVLR